MMLNILFFADLILVWYRRWLNCL